MMKAYYDAIEGRLGSSVALYIVIIGWLITSDSARYALSTHLWLRILSFIVLTVVLTMYGWNIWHWLGRWLEIRTATEDLRYMESESFTRYHKIPRGTWLFYFTPIFLMYVVILVLLFAIGAGWLPPKSG
jgi:hypothetical protein